MLNEIQGQILESFLQYSIEEIENIHPAFAIHGLNAILSKTITDKDEHFFAVFDILNAIQEVIKILDHPYPQNRSTGSPYVGQEEGYAVWEPNGHGQGIDKEPLGLLSLTACNDTYTPSVTREDVVDYVKSKILEKIQKITPELVENINLHKFIKWVEELTNNCSSDFQFAVDGEEKQLFKDILIDQIKKGVIKNMTILFFLAKDSITNEEDNKKNAIRWIKALNIQLLEFIPTMKTSQHLIILLRCYGENFNEDGGTSLLDKDKCFIFVQKMTSLLGKKLIDFFQESFWEVLSEESIIILFKALGNKIKEIDPTLDDFAKIFLNLPQQYHVILSEEIDDILTPSVINVDYYLQETAKSLARYSEHESSILIHALGKNLKLTLKTGIQLSWFLEKISPKNQFIFLGIFGKDIKNIICDKAEYRRVMKVLDETNHLVLNQALDQLSYIYSQGIFNSNPLVLYRKSIAFFKEKNYPEALRFCSAALEGFNTQETYNVIEIITCHSTLASCYRECSQLNAGIRSCEKAFEVIMKQLLNPTLQELIDKLKAKYTDLIIKSLKNNESFIAITQSAMNLCAQGNFLAASYKFRLLIDVLKARDDPHLLSGSIKTCEEMLEKCVYCMQESFMSNLSRLDDDESNHVNNLLQ